MTHSPTRRAAVAVLATTALVTMTACNAGSSSGPNSASTPATGSSGASQAISIGLVAEPSTLDITSTDVAAIPQVLLGNIYEGLVRLDQSGKVVGSLASAWTVSADRKTYTFDLVADAKYSNGAAFTAADAVFSITKAKTWTNTKGKTTMDVVASATAPSATQLVVTLKAPSNQWLYKMANSAGVMFSKDGVADLATKPIGTGPYLLGAWKRGDSITLTRNPAYWGTKPHFENVTLKYFKDATALNNALLSNAIDVVGTVQAPEALAQFTGNDAYEVIEGTTNGEVVLSMNNAKAPFNDKRVRQAARSAIDHQALMQTCWAGRGTLIGSMVPPTDPWYEDLTGVAAYDQAKAKSLLAAAGQPNPTVRLRIPTLPYAVSCGQVVKSQLEAVGFTVQLQQLEFPAAWISEVFTGGDYEMSIVAHVEPRDLAGVFGNPDYYLHYKSPALTAALTAADTGTEAEQVSKMKEAARIISEDAAADWLFLLPNLIVAKKGITGLPKNNVGESFDLSALGHD